VSLSLKFTAEASSYAEKNFKSGHYLKFKKLDTLQKRVQRFSCPGQVALPLPGRLFVKSRTFYSSPTAPGKLRVH